MAHYRINLEFLAPIPVDHRVRLDYYEMNTGIFSESWELDRNCPVVIDLETGITWAEASHYNRVKGSFVENDGRRLVKQYWGVVTACDIASDGGDYAHTSTRLEIFPTEGPEKEAPYR